MGQDVRRTLSFCVFVAAACMAGVWYQVYGFVRCLRMTNAIRLSEHSPQPTRTMTSNRENVSSIIGVYKRHLPAIRDQIDYLPVQIQHFGETDEVLEIVPDLYILVCVTLQ